LRAKKEDWSGIRSARESETGGGHNSGEQSVPTPVSDFDAEYQKKMAKIMQRRRAQTSGSKALERKPASSVPSHDEGEQKEHSDKTGAENKKKQDEDKPKKNEP